MADHRPPVLAALILAAGYSSRMGRFKPLLELGGVRIVESLAALFRSAGIERIGVVTGHLAARLEPVLHQLGIAAVTNPAYEQGMYSSVQAGLAWLPKEVDACFLLPVDIPLVRSATIEALAERYAARRSAVIYPRFRGERGHPPLIDRSLFGEILAGGGDGGLRAVLERHRAAAAEVEVIDQGILLDMDTPDDYLRLAALALCRHLPTAAECEAILEARSVAEPIRRHSRAVAAVAQALAMRLAAAGSAIDRNLVLAASLLHDVAKGQPDHAQAGAAVVADLGYPAVAEAVRQHMDLDFAGGTPNEAAIVFLADKLVKEDRRVSLEERFGPAFERFRDEPAALRGATRRYRNALAVCDAIERCTGKRLADALAERGVASCP